MPAATKNDKVIEAGAKFRQLRDEAGWKMTDVERESRKRFGDEGVVKIAQLSHIEKGQYDRVSLDDAVRLGRLYGRSPNQVAEMYGLWSTEPSETALPREVTELLSVLDTLPYNLREKLLHFVEHDTFIIRGEALEQSRAEEQKQSHSQRTKVPAKT